MQQGVSSHYTDRHLWGFWKKQFKYRSLARLLITNYLFMFEAYFPQCCFGMFTQMVLCSSLEHLFTNTSTTFTKLHDPAWTVPDLRIVLTFLQKKTLKQTKKPKPNNLNGLTCDHGVRAVPLGVLLALAHAAGAGLCLVGAQRLPLTLQTVLVLQVVLHV